MVVLGAGQNLSESRRVGSVSGRKIGCLIIAWIIVVVKFKLLINPCRRFSQWLGTILICNDASIYYTLSLHNIVFRITFHLPVVQH